MDDKYWAEAHRDGEIDVVCEGDFHEALASGKACQFYEFDYKTAVERLSREYPEADYWYTERNGDPITMLVPKGTKHEHFPTVAMDYIAFRWEKHDALPGGANWTPGR